MIWEDLIITRDSELGCPYIKVCLKKEKPHWRNSYDIIKKIYINSTRKELYKALKKLRTVRQKICEQQRKNENLIRRTK